MVTHRSAEQPPDGDFVFTRSLVEAIDQARAAAGGKRVHMMGGADLIRQALAAGLAGELTIIIAPVTLGAGSACPAGSANPWNWGTSECASPRSRPSLTTA